MGRWETRGWASGGIGIHALSPQMLTAAILLMTALLLAFGIADGDVPTIADVQACNQEARLGGRTASPTEKDEIGADNARNARAGAAERPDTTGTVTRAADPQIDGIDAAGSQDAAYRAAYRVCMRMRGF